MQFQKQNLGQIKYYEHTDRQTFTVYKGIRLSLFFDERYNYLAISPSFVLEDNIEFTKETIKEISKQFYAHLYKRKPNLNFEEYILGWKKKLFNNQRKYEFEYPINSGSGFCFVQSSGNAHIGITQPRSRYGAINLPTNFDQKQIVYKGIEYPDPQLTFYNPANSKPIQDFHPMRGLVNNQPFDYFMNNSFFNNPSVNLNVICPNENSKDFHAFLNFLNQYIEAKHNPDYLISFPGFFKVFGIPINIPTPQSQAWKDCQLPAKTTDTKEISYLLAQQITQKIEDLHEIDSKAVIVIFIPESWKYFTDFNDGVEHFDLHNYIKAFAVQRNISTQLIREKTIESSLSCQIRWWLSLAFYVKSLRTPWILTNLDKETAFAGLGYSLNHDSDKRKIVLGCSHIYTAEGQGLKYKLSKINDFKSIKTKCRWILSCHAQFE